MAENKSDRNNLFELQLIKQRNFSELEMNILDLLDSLRQSATSENAMQAALQIDLFCPPLDAERDELEAYLWALWEVISEVARSPDVTSEIHIWLVNILQNSIQVAKGNHTVWGAEQRVWGDLPLFGQCLDGSYRNIEKDPYLAPEEEYNPVYIEIWRKLSSFAARCTGANILVAYTQAADALRGALEEEVNKIQGIPSTECRILVACEWITHAAKPILLWARQNNGHLDVTKEDAGYIEPGPLYTGPPVVCLQRWGFWQNRFGELGNSEAGLREEIRNAVLQAAGTMKRIEKSLAIIL